MFRKGASHLTAMANKLDIPWEPDLTDGRRLHNNYVRNLTCAYASKFADLSNALLSALQNSDYLTYALCGRAMIEIVANLRYYIFHQYRPLLDKGNLSSRDIQKLVEIDDRHLRGARFDWESFLFQRYSKLKEDAIRQLKDKKSNVVSEAITIRQVNAQTCIEKWAEQMPEILIAYSLFCDLVHPNIGSNFLVASTVSGKLYFTKSKGEMVGHQIFEQSFPILVSSTQKPFGEFLSLLMATCWQDAELACT